MDNWLESFQQKNAISDLIKENNHTSRYGLTLTEEDAIVLTQERKQTLQTQRRIEFGAGILPSIIHSFCDSPYITQTNYVETLIRLQDIFYLYKNETEDEMSDDELITFMQEQFDTICYGDLDYLESTCLAVFARAVRAGYRGYESSEGIGEYARLDEVPRWSRELFLEALENEM